ncbi:saccharopine dehydrogenase NADP-binding domain-containing protein [Bradyrhizobium sp. 2S1]|uniref:saccharopine dehydrogenase NADP-binding domain-containing protein n=1 Tax=Bradyrhizobium sp. 2S1 TaxID=1404429 RepID=UPI00140BB675|nr:saccharopine dehydrogenase NADP-binding domain-containing protein [Bradyrhizobium sp. 2S1]MCK7673401.1 saccharopine dehydrogenase NADP-binding domain-containing protein [Bradyrhizobium sp. 2S1]
MSSGPIGVLGASGQVGHHVVGWLRQDRLGPLRLGGRRRTPLEALRQQRDDDIHPLDLNDDRALAEFCRGCRVVVNCAGPSYQVLDRVARAAAAENAHYVDVSGDGPAHALLQDGMPANRDWIALLSAGMLPGLANLVPAWLSDQPGGALTVYSGGVERLSGAAAADLVLSLQPQDAVTIGNYWYGEAGASWELGRRRSRSLAARENVQLDFFPGTVAVLPYLSADAERLAMRHKLTTLRWFNVFSGQRLRETLIGLRGRTGALSEAVRAVERAGELDVLGMRQYYAMVFVLEQPQRPTRRAAIVTDSSLALTAATAAAALRALLRGEIPPGLHFADDVLSPDRTLDEVQRLHAGTRICRHTLNLAEVEEGTL